MFNKKAEMGIGTLILFIAMILVAAVAAGVLIQTASSLQAKALLTGSKSTSDVSTAMSITYAYGKNASGTDHDLEYTYLKGKLVPGSDPIKFADMVINVDTKTTRTSYSYTSSVNCTNDTDRPSTAGTYGVRFLTGTPAASNDYLYRGDVIEICLKNAATIAEGEDYRVTVVPKAGQETQVGIRAPDVMVTDTVPLYP